MRYTADERLGNPIDMSKLDRGPLSQAFPVFELAKMARQIIRSHGKGLKRSPVFCSELLYIPAKKKEKFKYK